jgi:dipeptidyl aminopeptidase/acylaminoacyl peptidase
MMRPRKNTVAFGLWPSPISPLAAAQGARRLGTLQCDGDRVYWTEGRPEEGGRQVIMTALAGGTGADAASDILPKPFSARSRVHEYGGGEFLPSKERVFFVNDADQDVWVLDLRRGGAPQRLTTEPQMRFSDFAVDDARGCLYAVAERHLLGNSSPENSLVTISFEGRDRGRVTTIASGEDFYAAPRLSPDGATLAYLAWYLPDMPWDSAAVWTLDLDPEGAPAGPARRIAGGDGTTAFQPAWAPDGRLLYVSDAGGFGSLYAFDGKRSRRLFKRAAEDLMRPHWVFGMRSYAIASDGCITAVFLDQGRPVVHRLDADGHQMEPIAPGVPRLDDPASAGNLVAALASDDTGGAHVAILKPGRKATVLYRPPGPALPKSQVSTADVMTFRGGGRATAYGLYYPPRNAAVRAPHNELPPAFVLCHGGPTAMAGRGLSLRIQFYTSRGFAVLDVDYAGSSGYGRAYRERLDGQWGIADVADCAAGARHLAKSGLADPGRIAIAGGSAGGYTVLMALATTKAFAAGSSHYGISDLSLLLAHTHKFESGYLHRLMGTTPKAWKRVFKARSPMTLIGDIKAPVILFQGLDDKVVPPEQSRLIAERLKAKGVPVALHEFAGEGHGFRRSETIVAVLEAELAFLSAAMGIEPTSGT